MCVFVKLFIISFYNRSIQYCLKNSEYPFLLIYVSLFPHRIYRRKTKPAYTLLRASRVIPPHNLLHPRGFASLNEQEHVLLLPRDKISLLLLETIFSRSKWPNVVHEFLMEGTARLVLARFNRQFCMFLPYKMMNHQWPLFDVLYFYNLEETKFYFFKYLR